jgi:DNA (cytosine-5)-methyltransferase 1
MAKKIILLDGCCKAGGASYGYYKAAKQLGLKIKIVAVDIEPQKIHPPMIDCEHEFIQNDLFSELGNIRLKPFKNTNNGK